jgi:hypothetical protein
MTKYAVDTKEDGATFFYARYYVGLSNIVVDDKEKAELEASAKAAGVALVFTELGGEPENTQKVPEAKEDTKKSLGEYESLTRDSLVQIAESKGKQVTTKMTKAAIIELLED